MHELHGVDELKHELPNALSLKWTTTKADGFVKITHRTELQDQIHVNLRFESMDEVDSVRVIAKTFVTSEFQEMIVARGRTSATVGGLGQALDGHELVIGIIFGQENHTEGSMVERGNRLETPVQEHALDETILHAVHSSPVLEDTDKMTERSR